VYLALSENVSVEQLHPDSCGAQKKHHAQDHQFQASYSFYAYSGQQSNPAAAQPEDVIFSVQF
jgi:hypothetical protein